KRRYAGQSLQQIQRRALADQQNVGGAFDARELAAGADRVAVESARFDLYLTVEAGEDGFSDLQAAENEILLGEKAPAPRLAAAHNGGRRNVAAPHVFFQQVAGKGVNHSNIKFHILLSTCATGRARSRFLAAWRYHSSIRRAGCGFARRLRAARDPRMKDWRGVKPCLSPRFLCGQ